MKKIYSLVLLATTLLFSTNVMAVEVADLAGLQAALAAGGDITLTADINAGATTLTVSKGITLNGDGHHVKGTAQYVFQIQTEEAVRFENMIIWSAKTNKGGQGVWIGGVSSDTAPVYRDNQKVTFDNVTINATNRGMDIFYGDNIEVTINNCIIQNVQGQSVDEHGNPTAAKYDIELTGTNASNTRGVNFGHMTNSKITITNSTLQGFFYEINNITGYDPNNGIMSGCKVAVSNCDIKGRAALNVWGYGGEYEFSDCNITGINNYGGGKEGFACFVFNNQATCHDNTLTINGGTVVSAVFNETGSTNPNANQYFIADRATNNTIVVNNAQYSCTKDLGPQKGGLFEKVGAGSSATINGGIYDCPEIVETNQGGGNITINGGNFDILVVSSTVLYPEAYEAYFDNVANNLHLQGGTFAIDDPDEDILALAFAAKPEKETVCLIDVDVDKKIDNQNGSVTVVNKDMNVPVIPAAVNIVWGTESDWTDAGATATPDANTIVSLPAGSTLTVDVTTAVAKRLDLGSNVIVTVSDGAILNIGNEGVNFADETSQVIVEAGGQLLCDGLFYNNNSDDNIIIKSSATSTGVLLINPDLGVYGDYHPMATVQMYAKAKRVVDENTTTWYGQHFGVPMYTAPTKPVDLPAGSTYIYGWENGGWNKNITSSSQMDEPFRGYIIYNTQPTEAGIYTFHGRIVGNGNAAINLNEVNDFNVLGNSYNAPIDVKSMLDTLSQIFGDDIEYTIWIYNSATDGHIFVSKSQFEGFGTPDFTTIAPMQGFILNSQSSAPLAGHINYKKSVWENPDKTSVPILAPARRATNDIISASIVVSSAKSMDKINLFEDGRFSDNFDNGYDASKYMNERTFSIFAENEENTLSQLATDNLSGKTISLKATDESVYTMSFKNVNNFDYAIRDNQNNAIIPVVEGQTYSFNVVPGTTAANRFEIIESRNMPTALDEVSAAHAAKGIYTVLGQYLGASDELDKLPKGVYVVDGVKIVK